MEKDFAVVNLKGHLGRPWEDYRHTVTDEFLCMVTACALGTDVCHRMFLKRSTCFKVNKMALQIQRCWNNIIELYVAYMWTKTLFEKLKKTDNLFCLCFVHCCPMLWCEVPLSVQIMTGHQTTNHTLQHSQGKAEKGQPRQNKMQALIQFHHTSLHSPHRVTWLPATPPVI